MNEVKKGRKRGIWVDNDLNKDIESFRKEMHNSTWSEAARQLMVKGLTAHEREKRGEKYS